MFSIKPTYFFETETTFPHTMQVESDWKSTANLKLLVGTTHPPAKIEKSIIRPGDTSSITDLDCRSVVDFKETAYCARQDLGSPRIASILIRYYKEMLRRVNLSSVTATTVKGERKVKEEEADENDEATPSALIERANGATFRGVGVLTQVSDPVVLNNQHTVPWEFYVIHDLDDDDEYRPALKAMTKDAQVDFALLNSWTANKPRSEKNMKAQEPDITNDSRNSGDEGQRLSLYSAMVEQFTGIYPGMAVGIVGDPFQRNTYGVLTGVLIRHIVQASRPQFLWHVDRPLISTSVQRVPKALRVHFCSGPFPRRDVRGLLKAVVHQALHRGADVLIIGGPLILPFETEMDQNILPTLNLTFSELLEQFVESVERVLEDYYATRPKLAHLKVVFVPHTGDVTQVPVIPTTMYSISDTEDIRMRSNPCRLSINGIHFGICTEDVVSQMQKSMIEKWPVAEGSLRRVVEAVVQSRTYAPLFEFPMANTDLTHLEKLRLGFIPPPFDEEEEPAKNWNLVFSEEEHAAEDNTSGVKRLKRENGVVVKVESTDSVQAGEAETIPHVLFLPSSRPGFAVVSHRGVAKPGAANGNIEDECPVDDTENATGVLVVNQEIYSKRGGARFELRVAEVTIPDCELAACRGAIPSNGVAAGVLHIYKASEK
ncbi:DNA polymerase alpha subunit B [Angomonas deanei]|nr:DNA polymerase alpha subunit B [Angomonas deanei]|eukprot:EPY36643.1 DNA polymerase alpha subunit B [Angomonas deanei]